MSPLFKKKEDKLESEIKRILRAYERAESRTERNTILKRLMDFVNRLPEDGINDAVETVREYYDELIGNLRFRAAALKTDFEKLKEKLKVYYLRKRQPPVHLAMKFKTLKKNLDLIERDIFYKEYNKERIITTITTGNIPEEKAKELVKKGTEITIEETKIEGLLGEHSKIMESGAKLSEEDWAEIMGEESEFEEFEEEKKKGKVAEEDLDEL